MGARTKLNVAYLNGCLLAAALVGLALGSWTAAALTLAAGLAGSLHAGDIRPTPRRR